MKNFTNENGIKTFFIVVILFASVTAFGQTFAPQGATWHYNLRTLGFPVTNLPIIFTVSGNQVINGVNCSRIDEINSPASCIDHDPNYIYNSGGVVYRYLYSTNNFSKLYDFNAIAGSNYTIGSDFTGPITVYVDAVSTISINGQSRIIQYVHSSTPSASSNMELAGPIIEGIGSIASLFPVIATCDPAVSGLRCYEDNIIGLYNTLTAPSCDSTYITSGIITNDTEDNISVFPNPCTGSCKFIFNYAKHDKAQLEVINLLGNKIFVADFPDSDHSIELTNIKSGVYLYTIRRGNQINSYRKLLVY